MNKETAIEILKSQKQKYADVEHKIYVANQTADFIENFLGKESNHYTLIKSFCLPNSVPDTSEQYYDLKVRNTVMRFQVCVDLAIDTIEKIGLKKVYPQELRERLPVEYPTNQPNSVQKKNNAITILTSLWNIISKNPLVSAVIISALILKYYHVI